MCYNVYEVYTPGEEDAVLSKVMSFRFDEKTAEELQEVAAIYRMSPSAFIALKIHQEYEYSKGNPKVSEALDLLEQMTALSEQMNRVFK